MPRFRSRPKFVEAVQVEAVDLKAGTARVAGTPPDWLVAASAKHPTQEGAIYTEDGYIRIVRPGGLVAAAEEGDWIVMIPGAGIYPCSDGAFRELYEAAE
jgi:hypothetical protein